MRLHHSLSVVVLLTRSVALFKTFHLCLHRAACGVIIITDSGENCEWPYAGIMDLHFSSFCLQCQFPCCIFVKLFPLPLSLRSIRIHPAFSGFVPLRPDSSRFILLSPDSSRFILLSPDSFRFVRIHPASSCFLRIHPASSCFLRIRSASSGFILLHSDSSGFVPIFKKASSLSVRAAHPPHGFFAPIDKKRPRLSPNPSRRRFHFFRNRSGRCIGSSRRCRSWRHRPCPCPRP